MEVCVRFGGTFFTAIIYTARTNHIPTPPGPDPTQPPGHTFTIGFSDSFTIGFRETFIIGFSDERHGQRGRRGKLEYGKP